MGILYLTESEVQRTVDPSYFISGYPYNIIYQSFIVFNL